MYDGYKVLIECDYKYMEPEDFSGILTRGGTILGTSRQRYIPGKAIVDVLLLFSGTNAVGPTLFKPVVHKALFSP